MSINQLTIGKLALALGVTFGALMAPNTASADHSSYVYAGQTFGFHGEAHMIATLRYMERGFLTHDHHSSYFRHAEDQLRLARYEVSSRGARTYLRSADRYLDEYRWNGYTRHLDEAARLVAIALQIEGRTHHHHVAPAVIHHSTPHAGHGYYTPHRSTHGGGVRIHSRWGHVGVRF